VRPRAVAVELEALGQVERAPPEDMAMRVEREDAHAGVVEVGGDGVLGLAADGLLRRAEGEEVRVGDADVGMVEGARPEEARLRD